MNKNLSKLPSRMRRQRGIAMIEILGALAIGAVLVASLSSVLDNSLEDVKGQQAAYYQSQVTAAAQKYIAANSATLQSSLAVASALAAVGVPELVAGKFLPAGMATRNVYGQVPCVLIRQPDSVGHPGQFDALVATSGGDQIPEKVLPMIASNAGPGGGYISTKDPANAKGSTWSSSTTSFRSASCSGGVALDGSAARDGGHLASNLFFDGPGQLSSDFLYRNQVPGKPELNRMNVPIRMASAALVTMGASCVNSAGVAEPGMAIDASTRGLAVCGTTGVWTSPTQWKNPVASFASLPAAGNTVGDVRMVTGLSRAFTYNGSGWEALAVDQNGNLDVPGTMTAATVDAGNVNVAQNIVANGTIHATGDISTSNSVSADLDVNAARALNAKDAYVAHNVVTQGLEVDRWTSSPAVTVGINFFVAGQACNYQEYDSYEGFAHIVYPVGTIVMDANYVPLICGVDKTMRYANGTYSP